MKLAKLVLVALVLTASTSHAASKFLCEAAAGLGELQLTPDQRRDVRNVALDHLGVPPMMSPMAKQMRADGVYPFKGFVHVFERGSDIVSILRFQIEDRLSYVTVVIDSDNASVKYIEGPTYAKD